MDITKIRNRFPAGIAVPPELESLCTWLAKHGYPISGGFELYADEHESIRHWFGTDAVNDRFGVFGTGPDGSLYAIWRQDDGRTPIVHMGSEGQNNFVLAGKMLDFLRLLAVGYDEIGFADLAAPPDGDGVNPAFRRWVEETFRTRVPATGVEIRSPAQASHQDFQSWIDAVAR
jgi:hypothetical protein